MNKALQVLLILPASFLGPLGGIAFLSLGSEAADSGSWNHVKSGAFLLGSLIGVVALWRAAFFTPDSAAPRYRIFLALGLITGLLLAAFVLIGVIVRRGSDAGAMLMLVLLLGGPVIVGFWNLVRILQFRPRR